MRSQFVSSLFLLLVVVGLVSVVVDGARTGGWAPVDPKDAHVVEVGKFAVEAHNKEAQTDLKFVGVVKAESQVVSGINYRITLEATGGVGGGAAKRYEAVVWEKAWEKFIRLTSFAWSVVIEIDEHLICLPCIYSGLNGNGFARKLETKIVSFGATTEASHRIVPGGWQPIDVQNDAHAVELAQYAVNEHNKQAHTNLKFESVIKGESQVVAGANYRLIIAAKDEILVRQYQAVVYEREWENYRELKSFIPITRA
ncbi:hypothetical protein Sjap_025093 [Stephania japonica]|uniref:Cystatin domain-containing protein n=1 Tax=Stephania japonica TaxID=461633 RepID=A0AAP0E4H8_9MAGN